MATLYHPEAAASWQGNYFTKASGPNGQPTWKTFTASITAAQAVANNIVRFVKLDSDTIVLGGYLVASGIDSHASATATIDVGYNSDDDSDVVDFFVDGAAIGASGAAVTKNFVANDLATTIYIPTDGTGYFVEAKILGTVATAAAGTITLGLLLANKDSVASPVA